MNSLEHAHYDLGDARLSLETAIELLNSLEDERHCQELGVVLQELRDIQGELERSYTRLSEIQKHCPE